MVTLCVLLAAESAFGALPAQAVCQTRDSEDEVLLVLAAASLADVLPVVAESWERSGRRPTVRLSFGASSRLARQVERNPAVSVFVGADREWLFWLEDRGRVDGTSVARIAGNTLTAVVPSAAEAVPAGPSALLDLDRIALAGENVPGGRYARTALAAAGVWPEVSARVVSANSVRSALQWAARGEVALAVVYGTDAASHPDVVTAFVFPSDSHERIGYFAAPIRGTTPAARDFVDFLSSEEAQGILADAGFLPGDGRSSSYFRPREEASDPGVFAPSIWSAVRISVLVALLATLAATPVAVALGWLFARRSFRGKTILSTMVMSPLVVPPVITGFLLLSLFGANAPLGSLLTDLSLPVPFTLLGAVLAALVVGMPLYVFSVRNAFEAVDSRYEELAATLGLPPVRTFYRVSLPLALPGIAAGALLAFARALGEFGATVVLAGNVEGSTRTVALAVYTLLESPGENWRIWTLVTASVTVSLVALVAFEALSRRQRVRMEQVDRF